MAQIWVDGFDHYGTGANGRLNMLNGAWAEVTDIPFPTQPVQPSFGARTGTRCLETGVANSGIIARRVLPSGVSAIFAGVAFYAPQIPNVSRRCMLIGFATAANNPVGSLFLRADGGIEARGFATADINNSGYHNGALLGQTNGPVIVASAWQHIEVRWVVDGTAGIVEVRVDETEVLNLTGLNTGTVNIAQVVIGVPEINSATGITVPSNFYWDDIAVRDTTGTVNNGFSGDLRIATLFPVADTTNNNWTPRPRQNIGSGILNIEDDDRAELVSASSAPDLEITNQDFTLEMFVRFRNVPTTTQQAVLASKYTTAGDERTFRLLLEGPDAGGNLVFAVSTDGTFGTVTEIHSFPWSPEESVWYHVAVSRSGGMNYLFIDGIQQGLAVADALTYFDGVAAFAIGGQMQTSAVPVTGLSVDGWMDEFRLTIGTGRYTTDFTPPTSPFPRSAPGDPDFADVVLLAGFDGSILDESSVGRTLTARNTAFAEVPGDGEASYQTINLSTPRDDTFVEAALVAATGTLTFLANPTATQNVVVGATTYTFVTTLVSANDVLIGVDAETSLDNLLAAVNQDAGEGTIYGTGTVQNTSAEATVLPGAQVLFTARTPGAAGNSIATTTTVTDASFTAATLTGGADIPGFSDYVIDRLPPEVTGVRSISLVNRGFKTDSGSSEVTVSFVTNGGGVAAGTAKAMTIAPTYREDMVETDPDTAGALTPSTLVNARIRLNRTL